MTDLFLSFLRPWDCELFPKSKNICYGGGGGSQNYSYGYQQTGQSGAVTGGDTATEETVELLDEPEEQEQTIPELPPEKVNPNVGEKEFGSARLKTEAEMTKVKRVRRETLSPRRGLALNPNYASTTGLNIGVKK
tara:strand:- start:1384 stop:1788 length:405 start_codon:yes stop_codon:yes gene_type:complete